MRERLNKHRIKISEMEAGAEEMEREIKKIEEEQLGFLARSAANSLTGGMEEIFELLRELRAKPKNETSELDGMTSGTADNATTAPDYQKTNENKEGITIDDVNETELTEETET
jgi:hypothetical protein